MSWVTLQSRTKYIKPARTHCPIAPNSWVTHAPHDLFDTPIHSVAWGRKTNVLHFPWFSRICLITLQQLPSWCSMIMIIMIIISAHNCVTDACELIWTDTMDIILTQYNTVDSIATSSHTHHELGSDIQVYIGAKSCCYNKYKHNNSWNLSGKFATKPAGHRREQNVTIGTDVVHSEETKQTKTNCFTLQLINPHFHLTYGQKFILLWYFRHEILCMWVLISHLLAPWTPVKPESNSLLSGFS